MNISNFFNVVLLYVAHVNVMSYSTIRRIRPFSAAKVREVYSW